MTARQLLADLHARGIELEARGDRLRWRPGQALTDADRHVLVAHKAELLAILTEVQAPVPELTGLMPGQSWPQKRSVSLAWSAELTELSAWFKASTDRLPCEPFGLIPGRPDGWAVWVSDPARFYSALATDIGAGPGGARARMGALAADLRRLRQLVDLAQGEKESKVCSEWG